MAIYDKPKRKNTPLPDFSIWQMISSLVSGIVYYGLVAPTRWIWQLTTRFIAWSWHQTTRLIGWMWRQTGNILSWSWRVIYAILRNTVFVPFIFVGRLLGFVANPVPKGLSAEETEAYQRINRQFRRQKRWYLHILVFLMGMATIWIPTVLITPFYPRPGMVVTFTVIWLIALGGHRLWMNLGQSEDREIGNALNQIRRSQQTLYYEEEIYDEPHYDSSRLEETDYDEDAEWIDEELPPSFKSKRQGY